MPYVFRHDAGGCTFIDDTSINCGVPDLNWYLEGYWVGRCGSPLSESNVISCMSAVSTAPKAESKDFHCDGQVWRTSNTDMAAGDWAKSSTKL
jgi:GH43 family beta-xylosidase